MSASGSPLQGLAIGAWNEVEGSAENLAVVAESKEVETAHDTFFPASQGASHYGFAGFPECHLPEAHAIFAKVALPFSYGKRAKRWVDKTRKTIRQFAHTAFMQPG